MLLAAATVAEQVGAMVWLYKIHHHPWGMCYEAAAALGVLYLLYRYQVPIRLWLASTFGSKQSAPVTSPGAAAATAGGKDCPRAAALAATAARFKADLQAAIAANEFRAAEVAAERDALTKLGDVLSEPAPPA